MKEHDLDYAIKRLHDEGIVPIVFKENKYKALLDIIMDYGSANFKEGLKI
jgi:hypothetical protein